MFKLTKTIEGINCISSTSKLLCFNTKQEELYLNQVKIDTTTSVCGYFFSNDYFVYSNKADYTNSIIDLKKNITDNLGKISLQFQKTENVFVALEKVNGRRNLVMFDLSTKEVKVVKSDVNFGLKLLNANSLIVNERWTFFKSLSLLTGEYEWEVDLGSYGEIRKIIGVVGDKLWVSLIRSGNHNFKELLVFNTQTGEVLQQYSHDYHFADFGVVLTEKNTILSLKGDLHQPTMLYEYDAQTMQLMRSVEVASLREHRLGVKSFTVYKENIYFTATDDSQIVANTVGVLAYESLALLWSAKVVPGDLMLDPPQVTDTNLYVLGGEGTLHIFEKEEKAL